jgi:hypothetical protein
MVAISALQSSSQIVRCRYIATVKALTKMKDEEEMKRGVHISGTISSEATQHYLKWPYTVTTLVNEKLWSLIVLFWISMIAKWAKWGW